MPGSGAWRREIGSSPPYILCKITGSNSDTAKEPAPWLRRYVKEW